MQKQGWFPGQSLSEYKTRGGLLLGVGLLLVASFTFLLNLPSGVWLQWRIDLAKPGATIILKPGRIQGNIEIAKSIVLVGARPSSKDVLEGSANTILGRIVVSGDSNVQVTLYDIQVIGAIAISDSARVRMERVQVSGSRRGLLVQRAAHVHLIDCVFSDTSEEGTLVIGNGILQGEGCQWVDNQRVGLRVAGSGSVELTACTIRNSIRYGLVLDNEASAVLADTAIHGTGEAEPRSGATIPKEYTSRYQWGSGVLLTDDSSLSLTNCTITGNTLHGIVAFDDASLSLMNGRATASAEIEIVTFNNASVFRKVEE